MHVTLSDAKVDAGNSTTTARLSQSQKKKKRRKAKKEQEEIERLSAKVQDVPNSKMSNNIKEMVVKSSDDVKILKNSSVNNSETIAQKQCEYIEKENIPTPKEQKAIIQDLNAQAEKHVRIQRIDENTKVH